MDAAVYRNLCARPDVMARRYIRAAEVRLAENSATLAAALAKLLESEPLPKPSSHDGGRESDFFWIDLAQDDVDAIVDALGNIEALQATSDTPQRLLSTTADLLDRWNRAISSRLSV